MRFASALGSCLYWRKSCNTAEVHSDFLLDTEALFICYTAVICSYYVVREQEDGLIWQECFHEAYLKQPNKQCCNTNGSHNDCVVLQQGLSAPPHPDIELLGQKVVVVVSAVVCQLVLDTGPWGAWVAAAEGYSIHQELPINIALQAAAAGQTVWVLQIC